MMYLAYFMATEVCNSLHTLKNPTGLMQMEISLSNSKKSLHSGINGGAVGEPMIALSRIISNVDQYRVWRTNLLDDRSLWQGIDRRIL